MIHWWQGLSFRERLLIFCAGGISFLVVLYQFVHKPLVTAFDDARMEYALQSIETSQTLDGLAELRLADVTGAVQAPTRSGESLELLISRTTKEKGLSILRLQPSSDDSIMVWLDTSEPRLVNRWMFDLENRYGMKIIAFDPRRQPDEPTLRGSVTLKKGTP